MNIKEPVHRCGLILEYLAADHRRLEALLDSATADPANIDRALYAQFRSGLLRHIGMEERILLPEIHRVNGGKTLAQEERLRLDHGAIAALLVPPPLPQVISTLRRILALHDQLEEGPGGVYESCDSIVGAQAEALIARLASAPETPVAPGVDNPNVLDATRRALARAGYMLDDSSG